MAVDKKISQLPEVTLIGANDYVPIVQGGQNKKIKKSNLANGLVGISGEGTVGTIPVFTGAGITIDDSILSQSAGNLFVPAETFFKIPNAGTVQNAIYMGASSLELQFSDSAAGSASVSVNGSNVQMLYTSASNEGALYLGDTVNTLSHTLRNRFQAPENYFNGDVLIADTMVIESDNGNVQIDFGSGTYLWLTTDAGVGGESWISLESALSTMGHGANNKIAFTDLETRITSSDLRIDAPTTFSDELYFESGIGIDTTVTGGTDVLNIGTLNANVINYGNASTIHNFLGTAIYELQVNAYVEDKLMTLNYGGAAGSAIGVGFEIEENSIVTGHFKTNASREGFSFLAPAIAYSADLDLGDLTANRTYTLLNASGTIPIIASTLGNSEVVETNGSGLLISAAKGTGYNKNIGITSADVAAGNSTVWCSVITADFTAAANTSEQTMGTISVPAGIMGINSELEVWAEFDCTANVNTKTLRLKIDGNTFRTFAIVNSAAGASIQGIVANKGSLTSQITNGNPATSAASSFGALGASTTFAVNTANAFDVTVTGQKATAGDTLTLKRMIVKIYNR